MKLVAEIITGRLFYVEIRDDAAVGDLKKQIGSQENLPKDRLILMLDSDERHLLDKDEVPLKDYGVQESSHIYIFFRALNDGSPASLSPSPSMPKETASTDPSPSVDYEANEDEPSNEANEPSSSINPRSTQLEE